MGNQVTKHVLIHLFNSSNNGIYHNLEPRPREMVPPEGHIILPKGSIICLRSTIDLRSGRP